jgi:hypothetical protein
MFSLAFPFSLLSIPGRLFGDFCCVGLNGGEVRKNEERLRHVEKMRQTHIDAGVDVEEADRRALETHGQELKAEIEALRDKYVAAGMELAEATRRAVDISSGRVAYCGRCGKARDDEAPRCACGYTFETTAPGEPTHWSVKFSLVMTIAVLFGLMRDCFGAGLGSRDLLFWLGLWVVCHVVAFIAFVPRRPPSA